MSKLFKLKEWLTLADAARHLSIVFGEQVTEADLLRLGLDGRLRLSVHFVNKARGRCAKPVGHEGVMWAELPPLPGLRGYGNSGDGDAKPHRYRTSIDLDGERFLNLGEEVNHLEGVWDLLMRGGERLDVEHAYQQMTGGPAVTLQNLDGAFVERRDIGLVCQLQESYDDNEFEAGSRAQLVKLERQIVDENIDSAEAARMRAQHKEAREEFLKTQRQRSAKENHFPAGGLPEDAVIVVRTEALREFEHAVNGADANKEKPLTSRERNTLLAIIAALCDYSDIKYQERGAAGQISALTEQIGVPVSDDTVRRMLTQIPGALESRMK